MNEYTNFVVIDISQNAFKELKKDLAALEKGYSIVKEDKAPSKSVSLATSVNG